jgi:hypothetical protein
MFFSIKGMFTLNGQVYGQDKGYDVPNVSTKFTNFLYQSLYSKSDV